MGEGGREAPLHFCLPGITGGGLEKVGERDKGAGAAVSALNRKLHNICSLALGEGVDSQLCVCFRMCFVSSRTCIQTGVGTFCFTVSGWLSPVTQSGLSLFRASFVAECQM